MRYGELADHQGLDIAYAAASNLYFDPSTSTMYISGTHSLSDVGTDIVMPAGALRETQRYKEALQMFLASDPVTVVGHSLGANIASVLTKDHWGEGPQQGKHFARYYAAPFLPGRFRRPYERSFRHYFDPISVGDRHAEHNFSLGSGASLVHSYYGHSPLYSKIVP